MALSRFSLIIVAISVMLLSIIGVSIVGKSGGLTKYLDKTESDILTERQKVINAIKESPSQSWPSGKGHVVLGMAGSNLENKGYHEIGGSFSPGFPSFGISVELFDREGAWKTSSNTVSSDEVTQFLGEEFNSIRTITKYYETEWIVKNDNSFVLNLESNTNTSLIPALSITSTGPAGAPINKIEEKNGQIIVNGKWVVNVDPKPVDILLQDERSKLSLSENNVRLLSENGDGFIRVILPLNQSKHQVSIKNIIDTPLVSSSSVNNLNIDLNSKLFTDSLYAQIFHLKAGIVNNETRPGDPGNYPLNWLRDGAYTIVALAKANQLALAKSLCAEFATNDFFGGFGAEGDAPGLALWALGEVAERLDDDQYYKFLWPHVERKAGYILEMLNANTDIHKPFSGPIVSYLHDETYQYLSQISRAQEDGMIIGKMDNHYPKYFVTAVSYLGLINASKIASRLGRLDYSLQYKRNADALKKAWNKELSRDGIEETNERTLISGLWPTFISDNNKEYVSRLTKSWDTLRDEAGNFIERPLWTYFDIAETHQWLYLGDVEKIWQTLDWFWSNQVSHGLYSWWEGDGEENSFGLWRNVRGWVDPKHISPHYWTAAEMLLLQLDMLAFENSHANSYEIVVGAGLKKETLNTNNVVIDGLLMRNGVLDWHWDYQSKTITIKWSGSAKQNFILGKNFPNNTEIKIIK